MRHSLENPLAYVASNLVGFTHVLEACRHAGTPHLTFASTSSVYGANTTHAVRRVPGGRPPAAVLRRHQARQRADGARLRPPLPPALHRPALLHRLRALGPARHGADDLRQGDRRGHAAPALQPRPPQPRLHLRRRHRRRRGPRLRPVADARPGLGPGAPRPGHLGRAVPHLQHRQQRAGRARRLHRRARARARPHRGPRAAAAAARRRPRHLGRQLAPDRAPPAGAPPPRSPRACAASSPGTGPTPPEPRPRRPACARR